MQHERLRTEAFAAASSSPKKPGEATGSDLVPEKYRALYSEAVERRLLQLARAMERRPEVVFT